MDDESRVGRVTTALNRVGDYKPRVANCEGDAAATFLVDASGVELERPDGAETAPDRLDYRNMVGREASNDGRGLINDF